MDATEKQLLTGRRRIYLTRHGDVHYFDADGRPFHPNTVPLNDEGRRQAEILARDLAAVSLDRVVCSDLPRCVETAQILVHGRGLPIETVEDLREVQPGRLADVAPEAVEHVFLRAFDGELTPESRFLTGETFGSLLERVLRRFDQLLADRSWQSLLLVAHGGVNRAILGHALGLGLGGFRALEQDPACLNVLDVTAAGNFVLRLVNHTPYAAAKSGLELTTMERLYLQYRRQR